ncbi:MAG: hypothetical protein OEM98_03345 [Gammaproteobacteria bacterium]|nr:hypothetical protein [Gammaproteobacteria bacterium]
MSTDPVTGYREQASARMWGEGIRRLSSDTLPWREAINARAGGVPRSIWCNAPHESKTELHVRHEFS